MGPVMSPVMSLHVGEPLGVLEMIQLAAQAETLGYERVWVAETAGPDAFIAAGALAAATRTIEVGVAVVPVYTRTPAVMAMSASTLADVSGRTFRLGIGAGGQAIIEQWHGLPMASPIAFLRDTVDIVRTAISGERTHQVGLVSSSGFTLRRTNPVDVPIYLAALGPKALQLAGEIGDGVLLAWLPIDRVEAAVDAVRSAAEKAGRDPAAVDVGCRVLVAVTEEPETLRQLMPSTLASYLASPAYNRFFGNIGFAAEADAFSAAFAARSREGTRAAVTDRMIDSLLIVGDAAHCLGEIDRLVAAGVNDVMVSPYLDAPREIVLATIAALAPGRERSAP